MRIVVLVVVAVLVLGSIVMGTLAYLHHRDGVEIYKAQVCVDAGGIPWRPTRYADQVCLHRSGT